MKVNCSKLKVKLNYERNSIKYNGFMVISLNTDTGSILKLLERHAVTTCSIGNLYLLIYTYYICNLVCVILKSSITLCSLKYLRYIYWIIYD